MLGDPTTEQQEAILAWAGIGLLLGIFLLAFVIPMFIGYSQMADADLRAKHPEYATCRQEIATRFAAHHNMSPAKGFCKRITTGRPLNEHKVGYLQAAFKGTPQEWTQFYERYRVKS